MNYPPQPPQPPVQVPVHVCFSGSLECSGCNPCPECRQIVRDSVLPPALAASGLGEVSTILFDLLMALQQRGIDPQQHLGVAVPAALRSMQEMAIAYFRGYDQGWSSLHGRMQQGDLAGRYSVNPIAPPGLVPQMLRPEHAPAPMSEEQIRALGRTINGDASSQQPFPQTTALVASPTSMSVVPTATLGQVLVGPRPNLEDTALRPPPDLVVPAVRPLEANEIARMVAAPAPNDPHAAQNGTHRGEPVG